MFEKWQCEKKSVISGTARNVTIKPRSRLVAITATAKLIQKTLHWDVNLHGERTVSCTPHDEEAPWAS